MIFFTLYLISPLLYFQPSQRISENPREQQEEEKAVTVLKTEITALKQQHAADQHEIRTKDDRIDQLIREIRNLVDINLSYIVSNLLINFGKTYACTRFSTYTGRKMWSF